MARFKYDTNLQHLARWVGSTCHDGLLASEVWGIDWQAPRGAEHPESHPHTRDAVVYAECSSRTLAPGLQLCKECNDASLWCPTMGLVVLPIFDISRFQHVADEVQKLRILNSLLQHCHEDGMVDVVEVPLYVDVDKPFSPVLYFFNGFQGRIT